MDLGKNEVVGLGVRSYPTLTLYPAGTRKRNPIVYQGPRKVRDRD